VEAKRNVYFKYITLVLNRCSWRHHVHGTFLDVSLGPVVYLPPWPDRTLLVPGVRWLCPAFTLPSGRFSSPTSETSRGLQSVRISDDLLRYTSNVIAEIILFDVLGIGLMRLLRERSSTRIRASVRGILPAVVTLVLFLSGGVILGTLVESVTDAQSSVAILLGSFVQLVLYAVLIGVAVWAAATLERRPYTSFGLNNDVDWLLSFVAGVAITSIGIVVSLWWADQRGIRDVTLADASVTGPDKPLLVGVALVLFVCYFLLGNVYEEVVYRRIMLGNFVEGLTARGVSLGPAVVFATVSSLLLFGAYHIPLRGNVIVALDAALSGIPFAVAYLLTDDLGLPVGVHFGRVLIEFFNGLTIGGFEVTAIVAITQNTLLANLEFKLLRIALLCLCILFWVHLTKGEIRITETRHHRCSEGPLTD